MEAVKSTERRATRNIVTPSISDKIGSYFGPSVLLGYGILYFLHTLIDSPLLLIQNYDAFRHKAFALLWAKLGKAMSEDMPEGTASVLAQAQGVVLDIGPGTGTQLHLFNPARISMLYGVEPAIDMHAELLHAARSHGFEDKFEIIGAGAELEQLLPALRGLGLAGPLENNAFDCITCIRVLCGVTNQQETIDGLYRLLKPGGTLIFVEHVQNTWPNGGSLGGYIMQKIYMLAGWSFWLGGCCLDRDTESALRKAAGSGGWAKIELTTIPPWGALPHMVGVMTKA